MQLKNDNRKVKDKEFLGNSLINNETKINRIKCCF